MKKNRPVAEVVPFVASLKWHHHHSQPSQQLFSAISVNDQLDTLHKICPTTLCMRFHFCSSLVKWRFLPGPADVQHQVLSPPCREYVHHDLTLIVCVHLVWLWEEETPGEWQRHALCILVYLVFNHWHLLFSPPSALIPHTQSLHRCVAIFWQCPISSYQMTCLQGWWMLRGDLKLELPVSAIYKSLLQRLCSRV